MEDKIKKPNVDISNDERDQDEGIINNWKICCAIEKYIIDFEIKNAKPDNLKDETDDAKQVSAGEKA